MARIAGVDLPKAKRMEIALTYIFGIGRSTARKILREAERRPRRQDRRSHRRRSRASSAGSSTALKVEGDLRREVALNIKRYVDLGCYRGLRHRRNLPVRGQRTHTNARTRKGPRQDDRRQEAGAVEGLDEERRSTHGEEHEAPSQAGAAADARPRRGARRRSAPSPRASRTSTRRSTTRSSPSPTRTGNVVVVGERRHRRLQGLAQGHAVRRAARGRGGAPSGRSSSACAPCRCS